jgi:hypothetical protein
LYQLLDGFENHVIQVSKLALATKRLKLGPMDSSKPISFQVKLPLA